MSLKNERILFIIALVISSIALILIYVIGLEGFENPESADYVVRSLLYLFGLVAIRGAWKLTLDRKISSKKSQKDEH